MVLLEKILGFFYFDFRDNFITYPSVAIKCLVCKKLKYLCLQCMYTYTQIKLEEIKCLHKCLHSYSLIEHCEKKNYFENNLVIWLMH